MNTIPSFLTQRAFVETCVIRNTKRGKEKRERK